MPNIIRRLQTAWYTFRHGLPSKGLPFAWTNLRQEKPQWHLVDLESYYKEGFSMNSLIYSAIMYKIRATITAPLVAYTGDEYNPEPLPPDDPLSQLVRRPNERQSWVEFHARNFVFFNIAGNVYIYRDPTTGLMYSLNPQRMFIVPDRSSNASIKGYVYTREGESLDKGIPFLPEDVLHIKLPNPSDPLEGLGYGLSPLSPAAQVADVDNIVTNFLNMFFTSGAMVTGILKYDVPLDEDKVSTIRRRWSEHYGGHEKWGVGILDRGGDYKRVSLTFEEMGFDEVDARSETRILGPFGVAPILIGAKAGLERSTYSNYGQAREAVWEDTLVPELTWFETEYQQLLNGDGRFVQYDYSRVPALQRSMPRKTSAAYTLVQMGMPPNQALRALGLRVGDIPDGDKPLMLTGRGDQQGPRSDPETEDWGQRAD